MTTTTRFPFQRYLAPRFWPTWLGLGLLRACLWLPYPRRMALGRRMGQVLMKLMSRRRRIADTNLRLCFPELSDSERQHLLQRNFQSLGMALVETAMCWWSSRQDLEALVEFDGLQHLRAAVAKGQGVILLSCHFDHLELGGRFLAMEQRFHVMYRKQKNKLIDEIMRRRRRHHFEKAIDRKDIRGVISSLKQGLPVWYAPDQDYGPKHSVFAPFFNVTAASITATARFASMTGAPVVPFFTRRLEQDRGYQVTLLPALQGYPAGDEVHDATVINQVLEQQIRQYPEQYLWIHRRFKTRPPGEDRLY
jgi:KDO2-lipid IV(A) lauroyltransferase